MSSKIPYKIDPVKATCKKYKDRAQGSIQGINDTCFGICSAYSGSQDNYNSDPSCAESCVELVEQRKRELYGVGSCDHQAPYRPVFWMQTPRYVPNLLRKGLKPEQALEECKRLCRVNVRNLDMECIDNCIIDYDAIEQYKKEPDKIIVSPQKDSTGSSEKKENHKYLWVIIPIIIILLLIVLMIVKKMKK